MWERHLIEEAAATMHRINERAFEEGNGMLFIRCQSQ